MFYPAYDLDKWIAASKALAAATTVAEREMFLAQMDAAHFQTLEEAKRHWLGTSCLNTQPIDTIPE